MASENKSSWKRCAVCKRELGFGAEFYECSVSTCTSGRNHPVFCSVVCWDQHVPIMRHRDAWSEQKRSPTREQWEASMAGESGRTVASTEAVAASRRIVVDQRTAPASVPSASAADEILVVASKLKAYVRARAGMNTSDSVLDELSQIVRDLTDRAIEHARAEGRKTVMDRDYKTD